MPIDIDLPDFKIVCYCDKPSHMVRMRMREDQNVDLIYTHSQQLVCHFLPSRYVSTVHQHHHPIRRSIDRAVAGGDRLLTRSVDRL